MTARGTARVVWLDEADAQDPAVAGAKASRLARARARGLPVPDGFVTPVEVSDPVVRAAEEVLRSQNSGAARSAVYNHPPPEFLLDLTESARRLGERLVVRSSSRAEAEGVWAGAFSSYLGLEPEELAGGVIGCWASLFNPNTLKRGEMTGTPPHQVGMAVLVQPEIQPGCGGVATVREDGTVTVVGAAGHPAGLVAGWERGRLASVTPCGETGDDSSFLGSGLLREIADLSRAAAEKVRCHHIEWMTDQEGNLYLVQAQPTVDARSEAMRNRAPDPVHTVEPWMSGVVRMMIRYPGPLGEELVWRWAAGLEHLSPAPMAQTAERVVTLVEEVRKGASFLVSQRWEGMDRSAEVEPAWSALRNGDPSLLLDLISRRPSVDRSLAASQLRNLAELGRALTCAGAIPHPGWLWYLDSDHLGPDPPDRQPATARVGIKKWDPWIYGVITSRGDRLSGIPAAGGWGVGRLRFIHNAEDAARFSPREVIVTSHPVGNIAPLLWNAAGLITAEGSPAAHLFEVADWLAVPALCGVEIGQWIDREGKPSGRGEDVIVAVDGDRGQITRLS